MRGAEDTKVNLELIGIPGSKGAIKDRKTHRSQKGPSLAIQGTLSLRKDKNLRGLKQQIFLN